MRKERRRKKWRKKGLKKMEKVRNRSEILSSRSRTPLPKLMQSCQSFYAICNWISLRRRGATLPSPPPSTTGLPIDSTWLRLKTSLFFYSPSLFLSPSLSLTFVRFRKKKSVLRFFPPSFQAPLDGFSSDIRRRFPWSRYSPDTTAFSHSA